MEIVEETYVHKYGVSVPSEDWKERGEEGQVIATLKNGVVVTKNYVKGRLEGECTYTFPYNKQVQRVEIYRSNVLVSEGAFYPSGAPMQEIHFAPNGAKTRLMWYENGSPMSREEYDAEAQIAKGDYYDVHHNQDSKVMDYEGTRTLRDRYGILISQDAINNGRMAERITFHSNGTPKEIIPYEEETVNGNYKRFYPDGEPQAIEEWQDGRQHGLTILFENGEKIAEVTYANGMKTGLERRFREGSEITQEIYWLNNQRHGQCTTYLGRAPQVEWYYKGEPVTRGNFEVLSEALP
jgi:antitoxin component YwqK of YwqJK toxin-antitoxin module